MITEIEILQSSGGRSRQQVNHKVLLSKGSKEEQKSLISPYSTSAYSLLWLRRLALDPCKFKVSMEKNKQPQDHILEIRKFMFMGGAQTPQRKRKFEAFCTEAITKQNDSKFIKEHLSITPSKSYLLNPVYSGASFNQQVVDNSHCTSSLITRDEEAVTEKQMNFVEPAATKHSVPLVDSDESVNGSTLSTPKNPKHKSESLLDAGDSSQSSYASGLAELNCSKFRKLAIPIGPRFQAEVPTYSNNKDKIKRYKRHTENSKWLGTRVWPLEKESIKVYQKKIGLGRPELCSCETCGSSDCIKHHVLGNRLEVLDELASAFITWKFDAMGENVSKLWTLKEQKSFSSLKEKNLEDETLFWEQALKCLPFKCKKSILSYYFNVFIPRRLSVETKLSSKPIHSDDEEVEEDGYEKKDSRRKGKSKKDKSKKSNDAKRRYMRHVH